ncbi:cyclin-T1-4 [Acrasis kona]|uniref:Cyclin-T1-4 n=1 Tax=Acrasis kona TaxID=1008807 RepID=A0AAW2ZHP4_9EUKA
MSERRVTRSSVGSFINDNSEDSNHGEESDDGAYVPNRTERAAPRERVSKPTTSSSGSTNWLSKNRNLRTRPYKLVRGVVGNFIAPKWIKLSDDEVRNWKNSKSGTAEEEEEEEAEEESNQELKDEPKIEASQIQDVEMTNGDSQVDTQTQLDSQYEDANTQNMGDLYSQ